MLQLTGGELFAVNGPSNDIMEGVIVDYETGSMTSQWLPPTSSRFKMPHALTSSLDCDNVSSNL